MKIFVKGSLLVSKLHEQLVRVEKKKEAAAASLAEHIKHHKPVGEGEARQPGAVPQPFGLRDPLMGSRAVCPYEMQVKALTAHMDAHLRRLMAAIEVIDNERVIKMSLSEYINSYVESPYDGVVFPAPDFADDERSTLTTQVAQKLN